MDTVVTGVFHNPHPIVRMIHPHQITAADAACSSALPISPGYLVNTVKEASVHFLMPVRHKRQKLSVIGKTEAGSS